MSFADWHSGVPLSTNKQHSGFVCMSTVDDLSYTPSAEERTRDAAQILATGRRSWKTLKGKGEAVWPPLLEAALIEALEKYQPDSARATKVLGRFPMRNRFISDYIYETTGKRRTPKQVGSRLQQLRDTCKGERILQLISRRAAGEAESSGSSTTSSSANSEHDRATSFTPPPDPSISPSTVRTIVYVDILLKPSSWVAPAPVIQLNNGSEKLAPQYIRLSTLQLASDLTPAQSARAGLVSLQDLDPTITFSCPFPLLTQSTFSAFVNGNDTAIHSEMSALQQLSSPAESSGWLYSTTLAPAFWEAIIGSSYPSKYTLMQTVTPIRHQRSQSGSGQSRGLTRSKTFMDVQEAASTISIVYRFSSPEEAYPDFEQHQYEHRHQESSVESHSAAVYAVQHQHPYQDRYETVVQIDESVAGQQQWSEYTSPVEWSEDPYGQTQVYYEQRPYYGRVEYEYVGTSASVQEVPHGVIPKQEVYEYEYIDASDVWQDADGNYVTTAPVQHYHQPHHHHHHPHSHSYPHH